MEKRDDLRDFEGGMVVVGRLAGLSTSQTPDLLLFSHWHRPLEALQSSICVEDNSLLMSEDRRIRTIRGHRKTTVIQTTTGYENIIFDQTTLPILKYNKNTLAPVPHAVARCTGTYNWPGFVFIFNSVS